MCAECRTVRCFSQFRPRQPDIAVAHCVAYATDEIIGQLQKRHGMPISRQIACLFLHRRKSICTRLGGYHTKCNGSSTMQQGKTIEACGQHNP